jgi:hypothetical protein
MLSTKNIDLHDFGGRIFHKTMQVNVVFTLQLLGKLQSMRFHRFGETEYILLAHCAWYVQ